ncbi:MAG TPA: glycosyltransferase, partial [Anaerolineae bacterium]|nr:glycosyltransferase [Anaerolineae bacterium]
WRQPDSAAVDESVEVFGPSAAAALYRRSMLDQIGLFDETLFAYYEDVDLAWRAQWAGWRCLYVPTARVEHVHSATSGQGSPFKNFLLGRNKWLVILKNYPFSRLWWYVPLMILIDLGAALVATIRTRSASSIRGRWAAVRLWPNVRHWQREVRAKQTRQSIDWRNIFSPIQLKRRS